MPVRTVSKTLVLGCTASFLVAAVATPAKTDRELRSRKAYLSEKGVDGPEVGM
jgi:hypothetical protein